RVRQPPSGWSKPGLRGWLGPLRPGFDHPGYPAGPLHAGEGRSHCRGLLMTRLNFERPAGVGVGMLVGALMIFTAGCGQQPYGEVTGVVTRAGRPLPDVEVRFLPDPEKGTTGRHSAARTDAQGRYRLAASDAGRDGAPVGFHRVCVYDLLADNPFGG